MSNEPNYYAFTVKERDRGRPSVWTRIGAAWLQKKGQGLNIELEALPLNFDGKIILMPPKDDSAETPAPAESAANE